MVLEQGVQEHKEQGSQMVFQNMDVTTNIWYFIGNIRLFTQVFFQKPLGQ